MAKRPCFSDPPMAATAVPPSPHHDSDVEALLECFLALSSSDSIDTSFDRLVESRDSAADQSDFIHRAIHFGSVLLEAGKRSDRKRSSFYNAVVWPLPQDLTIKVFAMLDTRSVFNVAATCSFFQKCAMDPLCFAYIDLVTLVPKVNNAVVAKMIQLAGNALQSIKLGVVPPCVVPPYFSCEPADASGVLWNDEQFRQATEPPILTRSCLNCLRENGGAPGARLRRLHLFNIERMDNRSLFASLSACPSLVDLEIVGLHVELRQTLESVSTNCHLIERLIFESSKTGIDDGLNYHPIFNEFVLNCPKITTLALKGFKLQDHKARILMKGLRKLKYVDFSTSHSFTGAFLKNLGANGGANHLEVFILRHCMHLKKMEIECFMAAVLAGEFRLLRHLDISNREGLASDGDWYHRCYTASFIPIKQLLEQRPDFCLVADFPIGGYVDVEQVMEESDVSLSSQLSRHASDGSLFISNTSDINYSSDNEDSEASVFATCPRRLR